MSMKEFIIVSHLLFMRYRIWNQFLALLRIRGSRVLAWEHPEGLLRMIINGRIFHTGSRDSHEIREPTYKQY